MLEMRKCDRNRKVCLLQTYFTLHCIPLFLLFSSCKGHFDYIVYKYHSLQTSKMYILIFFMYFYPAKSTTYNSFFYQCVNLFLYLSTHQRLYGRQRLHGHILIEFNCAQVILVQFIPFVLLH